MAPPLWQTIMSYTLMVIICAAILLPFMLLILYSLMPSGAIPGINSLSYILDKISFQGYIDVFEQTPFMLMAFNSLWIAIVQTLLQLTLAFITAYAITRWNYPGSKYILNFVIASMIIPSVATMVPNYITINNLKLLNTYQGLIIPFIASGYAIFLMRQFFRQVPISLLEAAEIDNCNELRILWHIYLPMTAPAIAALGIILFVGHWNDYQWPLLILTDVKLMTLPLALVRFRNEGVIDWMPTAAACIMAIMPALILYIVTQKQFVETFASSATKG